MKKQSKPAKKPKTQNVFIRTVTHYYTGRVVHEDEHEIILEEASWIADTGRFHEAMRTGVLGEVEPYPANARVRIRLGAVVDICDWQHGLPRDVK